MSRENPDRSAEWGRVLDELANEIRASQNRTERFDAAVCELLGINRTDNTAIDIVDRAGQMTAGELAHELKLTTGGVTAVIDRMEAAGYLRRVPDAADRRRVLVELTPLAKRLGELIYGPVATEYQELSKRYTTEELELILDFMRLGNALGEQRQEHLAALAPEVRRITRRSGKRHPR